jgi:hypothetical protein
MHDLDRTAFETGEGEAEFLGEMAELTHEGELGEVGELNELNELELASTFLEISSEQELEQFLGGLIRRAGQLAGTVVRSDAGRALGGILKNAARQALPVVGRAIGDWVSPGAGGNVGARLATLGGQAFGLELEGLSNEDREFEIARRFVRFADAAARQMVAAAPGAPPMVVASRAAAAAARQFAPGLVPAFVGAGSSRRSGRWVRRGRNIVLFGV